jgi:di/tricarboxylate transporter
MACVLLIPLTLVGIGGFLSAAWRENSRHAAAPAFFSPRAAGLSRKINKYLTDKKYMGWTKRIIGANIKGA